MPVLDAPLTFRPIIKRLRWGGTRLASMLGKPIAGASDAAESWELADHAGDQSIVTEGPCAGWTLNRLVRERGRELLGRHAGLAQFPLLLKFLDAHDRLSVQVHPDDGQAALYEPAGRGKTEAWVIIAAEPQSFVYAGLSAGIDRAALERALREGRVEECLHGVPVAPGDCLFIPAGTVHAIGEGVLLAEVQQSSDLTFRLFDWNRVGTDGKPRPLHLLQALASIDFARGPVAKVRPVAVPATAHAAEELVRCPYFVLRRHQGPASWQLPRDERCRVLMLLAGTAQLETGGGTIALERGGTVLLPASLAPATLEAGQGSTILEVFWE